MNYDNWKLMSDRDEMSYADDDLCKSDVIYFLNQEGAYDIDVMEGETTCDVTFSYEGVWYSVDDLTLEDFKDMSNIKDMIDIYDDTGTACCGASYDADHRRCHHCKEAF